MYKHHYKTFFEANPNLLHFTAHSHHPWPDATRQAHLQYWQDAATLTDKKWEHIFGEVVPEAQRHIAEIIGTARPQNICFAPNTHEFVARVFSCFDYKKPLRILTTDGEFHSFSRQLRRLEEIPEIKVTRISVRPFKTFEERFSQAAAQNDFDFVFFSHVFFLCGYVVRDLERIVDSIRSKDAVIAIDGYHAFCAIPFNLGALADRVFYLGGGYKYAQSGGGVCFMHVPPNCNLRPANTGWFASFGELESLPRPGQLVSYGQDAFRFWGATFDPSGIYRFNAVMRWLVANKIKLEQVHSYVKGLQSYFIDKMESSSSSALMRSNLLLGDLENHGHFLTIETMQPVEITNKLRKLEISIDSRGNLLRFGFGMYQDQKDIDLLFERLKNNCI